MEAAFAKGSGNCWASSGVCWCAFGSYAFAASAAAAERVQRPSNCSEKNNDVNNSGGEVRKLKTPRGFSDGMSSMLIGDRLLSAGLDATLAFRLNMARAS